jgi:hypothetical protein
MCPSQLILWALMKLIMFLPFIRLSSSSFVLILQEPSKQLLNKTNVNNSIGLFWNFCCVDGQSIAEIYKCPFILLERVRKAANKERFSEVCLFTAGIWIQIKHSAATLTSLLTDELYFFHLKKPPVLHLLQSINRTTFPLISEYLNAILSVTRAKQINATKSILSVI